MLAKMFCYTVVPSPLILPVMYKKPSYSESAMHTRGKAHHGGGAPQSTLRLSDGSQSTIFALQDQLELYICIH